MLFDDFFIENNCSATPHSAHGTRDGKTIAVQFPNGHDSNHLVGSPAEGRDKNLGVARFEELLNDYDRTLLRFGMHISW
jgi:hypothetical protein